MEAETASSSDEQKPSASAADTRGKHRILAELKRFEQESMFLQNCSFIGLAKICQGCCRCRIHQVILMFRKALLVAG
ncbi:hypothetical protein F3Y22_tig00111621pilonHSYRG00308 [Hibiscus syriacus]|uniref:Uncharacterized protein n=1 Tax=Hibiscus syriacus TaxID=106335 RepID=A0A6A2YCU0_HIBSY|nr:hypothetical protein F3Y22_tig00111621pilonHSYRG00308 [Hibiscus syriacus]